MVAWDNESIDHWKPIEIGPDDVDQPLVEESSFATLFPKVLLCFFLLFLFMYMVFLFVDNIPSPHSKKQYREKYLVEVWGQVQSALKPHGIKAKLDVVEGCMTGICATKFYI